jgi:uncharacterized protein YjbI with pentapeptide repeats
MNPTALAGANLANIDMTGADHFGANLGEVKWPSATAK